MRGDVDRMAVGMNDKLRGVPKGTEQASLLAFDDGIGLAWERWGGALRALYDRKMPANDEGTILRDYGYWTDNGADYYYNYEGKDGYAGTMLAVRDHYARLGIPLGYLQLDSWWYGQDPDQSPRGGSAPDRRTPSSPRDSGTATAAPSPTAPTPTSSRRASPAFQKKLGLPLVVHGRWIDPISPYRKAYKISGIAPVDPRYWADTAKYLAEAGVVVYEQDWLDRIYDNSPDLVNRIGVADAFTDNMAKAAEKNGLDLQYCMGLPKHFLQGVQYPNLTTIRTSGDRFERGKWAHHLRTSELARQIGAYPWVDVFRSRETGNLILALLSAGPVGTGDAIGKEDPANIRRAARPDAVLVKADAPAVPCDLTYLNVAAGRKLPFLAATSAGTARYLFAFAEKGDAPTLDIKPEDVGVNVPSYLFDPQTGAGQKVDPGETIALDAKDYAYRALAPITRTGVALLGDLGKLVPTGRARIPSVQDREDGLRVTVLFAKGEAPVTLAVFSPNRPKVTGGTVTAYDAFTGRATVLVTGSDRAEITIDGRG